LPGLRLAEAGEFTRRAFANGKLDLAQAEGLADLLAAETESQRRQALRLAEGGLGRLVEGWQARLLGLAARTEAAIEFGDDEADVIALGAGDLEDVEELKGVLRGALAAPPAERLRDGVRVVVAGPANAGKSSLINALAGREVAIASPIAGTTRDLIEAPVVLGGIPLLLIDSAGLRDNGGRIERMGVERAKAALEGADLILWLGEVAACPAPERAILVSTKADVRPKARGADVATSTVTGEGMDALRALLIERVRALLPAADAVSLNARHRALVALAAGELDAATRVSDPILIAEHLRTARIALDRITGKAGVEDMLDALFGRFCIGK
jgi:tRNA modification GTPase